MRAARYEKKIIFDNHLEYDNNDIIAIFYKIVSTQYVPSNFYLNLKHLFVTCKNAKSGSKLD